MNIKFRSILSALFPPLALALFPVLFLFSHNRHELLYGELWFPLLAAGASALIAFFFFAHILKREICSASLLASLFICAFWYYGFFYESLFGLFAKEGAFLREFSRNRTLIVLWAFLWGVLLLVSLKWRATLRPISKPLSLALILLLLLPIGNLVAYEFTYRQDISSQTLPSAPLSAEAALPDIYYLIPDGRANSEILSEFFGYDDSAFRKELGSRGFHIVENSLSNYPSTRFSLPSTFNMEYLSSSDLSYTRQLAEQNKAASFLKERGYKFVFVGSGSSVITGEEADVRFTSSDFHRIVQSMTALGPLMNPRTKVLNAFSDIEKAAKLPGPKFVIVHILIPHVPYVFGENGEYIGNNPGQKDTPRDMELYLGQLKFADKKFKEAVDTILAAAGSTPPIVVIQSDHGVHLPKEWVENDEERAKLQLRNFSAFLLPGKSEVPPESWSAVNTFRFLFDLYFSTNFGFLEDRYWPSGTSF